MGGPRARHLVRPRRLVPELVDPRVGLPPDVSRPLHLFDANIFFPYRYTLALSEHQWGIALLFFPALPPALRPSRCMASRCSSGSRSAGSGHFASPARSRVGRPRRGSPASRSHSCRTGSTTSRTSRTSSRAGCRSSPRPSSSSRADVEVAVPHLGDCGAAGYEHVFAFQPGDEGEHELSVVFRGPADRVRHYPWRKFTWKKGP